MLRAPIRPHWCSSRVEAEQICRAIAALPEDYRVVSALYFMEEFSP